MNSAQVEEELSREEKKKERQQQKARRKAKRAAKAAKSTPRTVVDEVIDTVGLEDQPRKSKSGGRRRTDSVAQGDHSQSPSVSANAPALTTDSADNDTQNGNNDVDSAAQVEPAKNRGRFARKPSERVSFWRRPHANSDDSTMVPPESPKGRHRKRSVSGADRESMRGNLMRQSSFFASDFDGGAGPGRRLAGGDSMRSNASSSTGDSMRGRGSLRRTSSQNSRLGQQQLGASSLLTEALASGPSPSIDRPRGMTRRSSARAGLLLRGASVHDLERAGARSDRPGFTRRRTEGTLDVGSGTRFREHGSVPPGAADARASTESGGPSEGSSGSRTSRVPPSLSRVFSRRRSLRSILRRPSEMKLRSAQRREGGAGRRLRFADEVEPSSHHPTFVEVIDVPYTESKWHRLWRTRKIEMGFVAIGVGLAISTIIIVVAVAMAVADGGF